MADQDSEKSTAFICLDCDEREGGFSDGKHHLARHHLVRCTTAQTEEESERDRSEKRFDALEHKLKELANQTQGLASEIGGLTGQMERIERLLHSPPNARTE